MRNILEHTKRSFLNSSSQPIPCGSFPLPSVPSSRYSTLEHHASMLSFFGEASGPSTDATFALALGCKATDEQYSTSSCRDCPNITKVHHLCNVQAVEARRASHTRISLLGAKVRWLANACAKPAVPLDFSHYTFVRMLPASRYGAQRSLMAGIGRVST